MLSFAAAIKGPHQNLEDYSVWSRADLELKGVNIVTDTEVDAAFIKEQAPDVAILALGGARDSLGLEGDGETNVISIDDIVNAADTIGQNVTIVGGNMQATDVAAYLMEQGKNVTIVTPENANMLAKGQSIWCKRFALPILARPRHEGVAGVRARERCRRCGYGEDGHGHRDPLCLRHSHRGHGHAANKAMLDQLSGIEAYAVGDCDDPYNIEYAIRAWQLLRPGHLSSARRLTQRRERRSSALLPLPAPFRDGGRPLHSRGVLFLLSGELLEEGR